MDHPKWRSESDLFLALGLGLALALALALTHVNTVVGTQGTARLALFLGCRVPDVLSRLILPYPLARGAVEDR